MIRKKKYILWNAALLLLFFFVPNNRSEMITWRIDKVSASAEICDKEGWLELNCSAWTHATATDVMWVSDKSLHFRGRASSFEYADIWRKGSEMKLDEMSDTALTFGSQMLTQWEPTLALAGRHMWKQLASFCWCWQSLPASMRKTLENFFFSQYSVFLITEDLHDWMMKIQLHHFMDLFKLFWFGCYFRCSVSLFCFFIFELTKLDTIILNP